jgi:hypothetical protein
VKNSYRVGPLNYYICDNVGTDFVDGGNNTLLPANPGVGVIPASVLAGAGLQGESVALTTATAPEVAVVSPIQDHQVLISGRGFTPGSQVRIGAAAATQLSYIGPNQIAATLPADVYQGDVAVTTGAGTSPITSASYTYDPTLDVAVGKPATQSSTAFDSPAATPVVRTAPGRCRTPTTTPTPGGRSISAARSRSRASTSGTEATAVPTGQATTGCSSPTRRSTPPSRRRSRGRSPACGPATRPARWGGRRSCRSRPAGAT